MYNNHIKKIKKNKRLYIVMVVYLSSDLNYLYTPGHIKLACGA